MTRTLFVAWQDPSRRKWYPVGKLTSSGNQFSFMYTKGALEARASAGFQTLPSFPELSRIYLSHELFPLFTNRSLRESRPEYKQYLEWLLLPECDADPLAMLARSGGQRVTDTLEVFPAPVKLDSGAYELHFLVHGLSHMPEESASRVDKLIPGERLLVMRDVQNPVDNQALALRTSERFERDMFLVGYCPRYIRGDIVEMQRSGSTPIVTVERVNPPPAPTQFRLLCRLVMSWPEGFIPFSSDEYTPLNAEAHDLEFATTALRA